MPFPVARSRDEAHLYLDLNPCDICGSVETTWAHSLVLVDGELTARYAGTCSDCGTEREFLFGLPDEEVAPVGYPTFGGAEPSQLLDAGTWLLVAELTAGGVPADDPVETRRALAIATAAVEEIAKFIGPDLDRVPEDGFWSEQGRRVRDAEPSRFTRESLMAARDAYRELAERYRD